MNQEVSKANDKADVMQVSISSFVMPQMAAYPVCMLILVRLFSSLNMLSWENLVMPVGKTKRR